MPLYHRRREVAVHVERKFSILPLSSRAGYLMILRFYARFYTFMKCKLVQFYITVKKVKSYFYSHVKYIFELWNFLASETYTYFCTLYINYLIHDNLIWDCIKNDPLLRMHMLLVYKYYILILNNVQLYLQNIAI